MKVRAEGLRMPEPQGEAGPVRCSAFRRSFPRATRLGSRLKAEQRTGWLLALLLVLTGAVSASEAEGDPAQTPPPMRFKVDRVGSPVTPYRPAPARGPDAKVLLVYTTPYAAFSMADALENLALHVRRMDVRLDTVSWEDLTSEQAADADYLVVLSPRPKLEMSEVLRAALADTNRPALWVGYGIDALAEAGLTSAQVSQENLLVMGARVQYQGRPLALPPSTWQRATLDEGVATVTVALDTAEGLLPVGWREENRWFFASLPDGGLMGPLFGDLLLDFFGATRTAPPHLWLRIRDYHPLSHHDRFLRMVDYLYARQIPFVVGVVAAVADPETGRVKDLDTAPEFVETLRYAQQRGGRLILSGCRLLPEGHGAFWNTEHDQPLPPGAVVQARACVESACRRMVSHGLLPLAWETPRYAASTRAYEELAGVFSSALERVQVSDATQREHHTGASLTLDRHGRLILPENLGYVTFDETSSLPRMMETARELMRMRGTVVGCDVHAYLPLDRLVELVRRLELLQAPFLDLAKLDHRVRWPGGVLLTGQARMKTVVSAGPVRWRAFDRAGGSAGETVADTLFSGEHLFQRRGLGVVELYESMEGSP